MLCKIGMSSLFSVSSSLLLHKFGVAAEDSLLMLHLTDVHYYAGMVMKDVFILNYLFMILFIINNIVLFQLHCY